MQLCRHRSRVEIKEERIGERKKREEEEEGAMDKYVCLFYFILFYVILCYFIFSTKPSCYSQVLAGVRLQYIYRFERMEKIVEFARR